jgi:asparagine synthase (glutamine-hydrolysing)
MCGISAIFDTSGKPISASILEDMTMAMAHRGPDGAGIFVDKEVGLGHRRLSIIDLGGGAQPLSAANGELHVVFNGEIYNFVELRQELEQLGCVFRTKSDTEVIIHGYEKWGEDCVSRFNGMFAFALWDSRRRCLFLARDHLGIKPLYYIRLGTVFAFASEIKSLLRLPACPREVDVKAMADLFTFRYVPSPATLFKGIKKLPAAHSMMVSFSGPKVRRFWRKIPTIRHPFDESKAVEEYQALLQDAVRIQLRSDVPLGLFLSSGVDSAGLLALMADGASGPVQTFTIGFEGGESCSEVDEARKIARQFGADHYSTVLTPNDYTHYFERYMTDLEEPVGSESAAAFYFVAKAARERVKVALTGQGADEPWAGYDRYLGIKYSSLYSQLPGFVTGSFSSFASRIPFPMERLKRGLESLGEPDVLTRLTKASSFFNSEMRQQLYKGPLKEIAESDPFGPREALRPMQDEVKHLDPLTQILYLDTHINLPDYLLMIADKTSMANSLEVRVPFLDYRLIEFVESLPPQMKLKGATGKYLHKKSLAKWLPADVVYRKKKGFANPVEEWFRTTMRPLVEDCLLSKNSAIATYFDQRSIEKMLQLDRDKKEQYRRHIFLLVSFELCFVRALAPGIYAITMTLILVTDHQMCLFLKQVSPAGMPSLRKQAFCAMVY